jgi:DNA-binding NarL/FixJ family response regulator
VLRRLTNYQQKAKVPVVIVSNFSQEKDIEWGKELGVRKFMNKVSVTPVEIVDTVIDIIAQEKKVIASE